jgi:heptosyltransferase-2
MVMSQSLLLRLKEENPNSSIDVLAPDWCRPVLARMPQVRQAIAMPVGHGSLQWDVRKNVAASLRANNYQQSIVLPHSLKSALIPWMANIPKRTGWRGEMRYGLVNDMRTLDKQAFPLMVQQYIALAQEQKDSAEQLKPILNPQLDVDKVQQGAVLQEFALIEDHRQLVAFCPGAEFGPAKRWPHYHFANLAKMLIANNKKIVCLGSANDTLAIGQIKEQLSAAELAQFVDVSGKTNLTQAIDLLAGSAVVVSNDSGLMHIAAAVNTPLIALYGPTSPDFTPPLSDNAQVIRLIDGYIKLRRANTEEGYHQSMIDITPAMVFEHLEKSLSI